MINIVQINMEERLQKYLAECGIASRRKCEEYIIQGKVQVNGKTITELGVKVNTEKDKITFEGKNVKQEEKIGSHSRINFKSRWVMKVAICDDKVEIQGEVEKIVKDWYEHNCVWGQVYKCSNRKELLQDKKWLKSIVMVVFILQIK